jgi:hypothetical protein
LLREPVCATFIPAQLVASAIFNLHRYLRPAPSLLPVGCVSPAVAFFQLAPRGDRPTLPTLLLTVVQAYISTAIPFGNVSEVGTLSPAAAALAAARMGACRLTAVFMRSLVLESGARLVSPAPLGNGL